MNFLKIYVLILLFNSLVQSKDLKIMTEVFPPYQYKDEITKRLTGISTIIVESIQENIKDTNKIKVYPWSRGIKIVERKKNTALFSMLRTKDREDKYKWVGPLAKMQLVFFKRKGSPINIKTLEDAKKIKKIGVTKNVANYDILNSKGFKNLDIIKSGVDEKNIKKLVKGRIDLWPSLKTAGMYNAKKLGYENKIEIANNVIIFEGDLYIAFNKKTDDKIIIKWQTALDELVKNGTIDKIKSRY